MNAINVADAPAVPWRNGGGVTRELLALPTSSDWDLRLSVADIDSDGPFSTFLNVPRTFAVIDGQGVLLTWPEKSLTVKVGDAPIVFDGSHPPVSHLLAGPVRDLNLMCRNGCAKMWSTTEPWTPSVGTFAGMFACVPGIWSDGLRSIAVAAFTLMWTNDAESREWSFDPNFPDKQIGWWISHEDVQQ